MYSGVAMVITEEELLSHDDYENFASHLGIDYEDYYNMIWGKDLNEDLIPFTFDKTHKID
jgi:hypothetical protein